MAEEEEEQLYLLEVMVDRLIIHKEGIMDSLYDADGHDKCKEQRPIPVGPIKVKVTFFDFPTIEINEEEFKSNGPQEFCGGRDADASVLPSVEPSRDNFLQDAKKEEERWRAKNAGMSVEMWRDERERDRKLATEVAGTLPPGNRFTSGKSCLFPMLPNEMIKTIQKYPLEVQVLRNNEKHAYVIGQVKIELGCNFREAVTIATTPVVLPVSAFVEEKFCLCNVFNEHTADVFLFVRLSCFGATIFTQFKYIQGDKGVKSKTTEGGKPKKFRKKKEDDESKPEKSVRHPCFATEDALPAGKTYSSPCDDFYLPVQWRNFNDPDVPIQMCHPKGLSSGPPQVEMGYKCALMKGESVNLTRMFPGISHQFPKYDPLCDGNNQPCPCPVPTSQPGPSCPNQSQYPKVCDDSSKKKYPNTSNAPPFPKASTPLHRVATPANVSTPIKSEELSFDSNYQTATKKSNQSHASQASNAPPLLKSRRRLGGLEDLGANVLSDDLNTSKALSRMPSDFESEQNENSKSEKHKKKPKNKTIETARPLLRAPHDTTSCPAYKDGKCRCQLELDAAGQNYATPGPAPVPQQQQVQLNQPTQQQQFMQQQQQYVQQQQQMQYQQQQMQYQQQQQQRQFPQDAMYGGPTAKDPCTTQTCPAMVETENMLQGLSKLCDPLMQNISNLMPNSVVTPHRAGGENVVSICTCPKVPDFIPPQQFGSAGAYIRCECSNILTSINPVNVPYTCPQLYPDTRKTDMVRGQVAPQPIKIPPPPEMEPQTSCDDVQKGFEQSIPCTTYNPNIILSDESESVESWETNKELEAKKKAAEKKKKKQQAENEQASKKKKDKQEAQRSRSSLGMDSSEKTNAPYDSTAQKMLEEELDYYEGMVEDVKQQAKEEVSSKGKKKQDLEQTASEAAAKEKKDKALEDEESRKRDSTLYRYTAGMYPGIHIGHKECVVPYRMVPKNMGWLWNVKQAAGFLKPGRGWRPGAISENVAELMDAAKHTSSKQQPSKKKSRKIPRSAKKPREGTSDAGAGDGLHKQPGKKSQKLLKEGADSKAGKDEKGEGERDADDQRPTLHVHKRHGLYYVSMFPPKRDDGTEFQPIQFKIDPKHPDGPGGDSSLYESEDSSTNTEDSFQLEFVSPHTLKSRIPPKTKRDIQCQASDDNLDVPQTAKSEPVSKASKKSKKSKKGKKKGKKGKKGKKKGGSKKGKRGKK